MAVRIRLKRLGRRHRPFYRIAVMDSRSPRDGKSIEDIGHYDPMIPDKSQRVTINMERVEYWMSVGALPSDKVAVLIDKLNNNRFGTASEPPPMTAPKEPPPPEEPVAEETAPADETGDGEEAATEEAATEEAATEEVVTDDATDEATDSVDHDHSHEGGDHDHSHEGGDHDH
ncbi:MAG: 30S ribosomal protein S16, partial [Planctomycetota bacterium]|nr:30S ribosomal protein S16 [Planctomycetota bacterium]